MITDIPFITTDATTQYDNFKKFMDTINSPKTKKKLIECGLLNKGDDTKKLLYLFGHINTFTNSLHKKSQNVNENLASIWLSKVKDNAIKKSIENDIPKYNHIDDSFLQYIAKLSINNDNIAKLQDILLSKGIILIYEKNIEGMKLDGAVFKLQNGTPVIGMSVNYKTIDRFWFTLLHELAHIVLLHLDNDGIILDERIYKPNNKDSNNDVENEANKLAEKSFLCDYDISTINRAESILKVANKLEIHHLIIAGMINKRKNYQFGIYHDMSKDFDVKDIVFGK